MANYVLSFEEKKIIESLPMPLMVYGLDDCEEFPLAVSDGMINLLEKDREEIFTYLAGGIFDDILFKDKDTLLNALSDFKRGEKELNSSFEMEINGKYKLLNICGQYVIKNGIKLGYVSVCDKTDNILDVNIMDEYKNIIKENIKLNAIIDNLPTSVSVYEYSKEGGQVPIRITKAYAAMTGTPYAESIKIISKDPYTDIHPDDRDKLRNLINNLTKEGINNINIILRYINRKEDRYRYVHLYGVVMPLDEKKVMMVVTHTDVDENQRVKLELEKTEESLKAAIKHGGLDFMEWDIEEDVAYNKTGYPNREEVIENFSKKVKSGNWINGEDVVENEEQVYEFLKGKKDDFKLEGRRINPDGSMEWRRYYFTITERSAKGEPLKAVISSVPINELKKTEEGFNAVLKQNKITSWVYQPKTGSISEVQNPVLGIISEKTTNIAELYKDYKLVHPDDRDVLKAMYDSINRGVANAGCEARILTESGYKWISISYTNVYDRDGYVLHALGSSFDVTEQKNNEFNYDESLRLFNEIGYDMDLAIVADITDDKILSITGKSNVVDISMLNEYSKYQKKLLVNTLREEDRDWFSTWDSDGLIKYYNSGEHQIEKEVKLKTDKGEEWFRDKIKILKNPGNGHLMILITTLNCSMEKELSLLVQKVANSEFEFISSVNIKDDSFIMYINGKQSVSGSDFFGKMRGNIGGLVFGECADLNSMPIDKKGIIEALEKEDDLNFYVTVNRAGEERRKKINISYIDENKQELCFYIADISDIYFKEKAKNEELEKAKEEAEEANAVKTEFLGRMSHDMRTPLNAIIGISDFGIEEAERYYIREYFEKIRSSSEFLLGLLNDLLDLTRIENDKIELNPRPVKISNHVNEIMEIIKPRAKAKGITVHYEYSELFDYEVFDPLRTTQIFVNILGNAIKYSDVGSEVFWYAEDMYRGDGKVRHRHIIKDNGIGMSEEFQSELFKPFTRERRSLSEKEGGNGLGMSIVKNIVEAMGGTISCTSEKNVGTTFTIEFECGTSDENEYRNYINKDTNNSFSVLEDKKILLCEDMDINARIVEKILREVGAFTELAANGRIGVTMARENEYDAILMDIRMPIMDGLTAAKKIREFNKDIPIIALSANAYEEDIRKSFESGMNAHLSKPLNKNKLLEELVKAVEN